MGQAFGIVAVLGTLMMVYYFLLGRRVGVGRVLTADGAPADDATFGGSVAAFLEGVVAVLALAELAAIGGDSSAAFSGGALLGAVAAGGLVVRRWWPGRLGLGLLYGVLGLAASVPAIARLFDASRCDVGVDHWVRISAILVLAAVWAASLVAALAVGAIGGWRTTSTGLALFGTVDVILYMSGPIGAGLSPSGAVWIVWAAAVIGGLSGFAPDLVMMVCGLFLGILQFVTVSTGFPPGCESLRSEAPYGALVGFCVIFWLGAWLVSKVLPGRAMRGM